MRDKTWDLSEETISINTCFCNHYSQSYRLILAKVVLNFKNKDFISSLSYIALSRIGAIKYAIFENGFLQDCFLALSILINKKKIAKSLTKKNNITNN